MIVTIYNFVVAHWGTISVVGIVVLKWVYNAWPEGAQYPNLRTFIGEIVQEAPHKAAIAPKV